jgi:hypothetical protein
MEELRMKHLLSGLFIFALLCAAMLAQGTTPQTNAPQPPQASPNGEAQSTAAAPAAQPRGSQTPANALKIAPGSVIPVQLAKTVDAKKAKTGDEVVATVTQDMKTNSGDVIVPKDTKIVGHVTAAQARNKEQKESQLGIAFDHAVVKGNESPLPMSIQAIIAPQTNNTNNDQAPASGGPAEAPSGSSPNAGMAGGRSSAGGSSASGNSQPSQSAQQNYPQESGGASDSAPQSGARPPITGNTQGIIGMKDVKLESTGQNSTQGSVVSSEKNNVKIEKGTVMLLRVNQ